MIINKVYSIACMALKKVPRFWPRENFAYFTRIHSELCCRLVQWSNGPKKIYPYRSIGILRRHQLRQLFPVKAEIYTEHRRVKVVYSVEDTAESKLMLYSQTKGVKQKYILCI